MAVVKKPPIVLPIKLVVTTTVLAAARLMFRSAVIIIDALWLTVHAFLIKMGELLREVAVPLRLTKVLARQAVDMPLGLQWLSKLVCQTDAH